MIKKNILHSIVFTDQHSKFIQIWHQSNSIIDSNCVVVILHLATGTSVVDGGGYIQVPAHEIVIVDKGLLSNTQNCGLCMCRECLECFPRHRGLAIPTCIMERTSRTYCDAFRNSKLVVSLEVGGGENFPSIHGTSATRNFTFLVRGPLFSYL